MATRPAQDCRIRPNMADIELTVNGERRRTSVDPATPLLWVLRDEFGLTGTKFGCGIAQCGACMVRLEGDAVRSCVTPVSRAAGKQVTTIEGLSGDRPHAAQQAWLDEQVPQCGYCQAGQILCAAVLLGKVPEPTDADIDDALAGNLCRCGTYVRIRKAVHRAARIAKERR
jgi:aerobic-type carbon monoxide dehydrogenase small subunit (CoxS/CutS family)